MKYESGESDGDSESARAALSASAVCAGALVGAPLARSQPTEVTGPRAPSASSSWCEYAKPPNAKLAESAVLLKEALTCTLVSTASEKMYWSTSCSVPCL